MFWSIAGLAGLDTTALNSCTTFRVRSGKLYLFSYDTALGGWLRLVELQRHNTAVPVISALEGGPPTVGPWTNPPIIFQKPLPSPDEHIPPGL